MRTGSGNGPGPLPNSIMLRVPKVNFGRNVATKIARNFGRFGPNLATKFARNFGRFGPNLATKFGRIYGRFGPNVATKFAAAMAPVPVELPSPIAPPTLERPWAATNADCRVTPAFAGAYADVRVE